MTGLPITELDVGEVYECVLTGMKVLVTKVDMNDDMDRCFGRYYDDGYVQTSIMDGQLRKQDDNTRPRE
jgi:hypothetical protein